MGGYAFGEFLDEFIKRHKYIHPFAVAEMGRLCSGSKLLKVTFMLMSQAILVANVRLHFEVTKQ